MGIDLCRDQRCLVIAPHPDDETFGCGGTLAKLKARGAEVYVVAVSTGDLTYFADDEFTFVSGETRRKEFDDAMAILGVDDHELLFCDSAMHLQLDSLPIRELIHLFEKGARLAIEKVAPTMVVLPSVSYHQDHEVVFRAGFTACRPGLPAVKPVQPLVLSCDHPALSWTPDHSFHPNFYVDITDHLDDKLRAVSCYRSQLKGPLHHVSVENQEWRARVRGREVSVGAAEAFRLHRLVT